MSRSRSLSIGWARVFRGNRVVWLLAGTATLSLVVGSVFGAVVLGAQDSRSDDGAVVAGLITVPVERRIITNEIVARGDAAFADAVDLTVDVASIDGPAIVTGRVPAVGSTLDTATVALEVAGRPLIVLPGAVPAYRTMRAGLSGPDVAQLKAALSGLGIDPGDESSPAFDAATAAAVAVLYERVGYERPEREGDSATAVQSAEAGVRAADLAVLAATRELTTTRGGASASERAEQDAAIRAAERTVADARSAGVATEISNAEDALAVARVRREEALAAPNDIVEAASLAAAKSDAADSRTVLAAAKEQALPYLPASEVAFVPSLPRRVDSVAAVRGEPLAERALTASGSILAIEATLATSDATLVKQGGAVQVDLPDGTRIGGTVSSLGSRAPSDSAAGAADPADDAPTDAATNTTRVTITPEGTPEQLAVLVGQNVRVAIPVESTGGEVLAVPVAAVSAASDGTSRVEIPTGSGLTTTLVEVTTGLAAGGFVEVTAVGATLVPGDEVVVGR